jgi:hypothetical protein
MEKRVSCPQIIHPLKCVGECWFTLAGSWFGHVFHCSTFCHLRLIELWDSVHWLVSVTTQMFHISSLHISLLEVFFKTMKLPVSLGDVSSRVTALWNRSRNTTELGRVSCYSVRYHNQFLHRNRWCGINPLVERSQVITHIGTGVLGRPDGHWGGFMATATMAFIPNIDVVISYGQVKSHPSSHQLQKKSRRSHGSTFSHNWSALTGYIVQCACSLQAPNGWH